MQDWARHTGLIRHSNRQQSLSAALSCPKKGHDSYTGADVRPEPTFGRTSNGLYLRLKTEPEIQRPPVRLVQIRGPHDPDGENRD